MLFIWRCGSITSPTLSPTTGEALHSIAILCIDHMSKSAVRKTRASCDRREHEWQLGITNENSRLNTQNPKSPVRWRVVGNSSLIQSISGLARRPGGIRSEQMYEMPTKRFHRY